MRWSFTIISHDALTLVRDRLEAALRTASTKWFSGPVTFRGEVWDSGFHVMRNLTFWEGTVPVAAIGRFTMTDGRTVVYVSTHPKWWIVVPVCVWSAIFIRLLWQRLVSNAVPGGIDWGEIVVLVGFLVFGWVLLLAGFLVETQQYEKALTRILTTGS